MPDLKGLRKTYKLRGWKFDSEEGAMIKFRNLKLPEWSVDFWGTAVDFRYKGIIVYREMVIYEGGPERVNSGLSDPASIHISSTVKFANGWT